MPSNLPLAIALTCAAAFTALPAAAQTPPPAAELTLARLDCGTPVLNLVARFNDTWAFTDNRVMFTFSCYLIKRGDEYMLWDTGHALTAGAPAPKVSIVDQLAQINVKPEQIKFVGISHYHADHTPGHRSLLVQLKGMGPVLISGDLTHFQENYANNGVPTFNFHRGDTLASLDRFKTTAANLKATVIIQHDARDVGKLPAWPASAK